MDTKRRLLTRISMFSIFCRLLIGMQKAESWHETDGCKQGFKVKVLTRTVLSIAKAADRDTECRLLLWMDTNRGLLLRLLSGIWRIL
jgi:hypothetical protein